MNLLEPMEKEIETSDGQTKTFIISKFDAISGREIVTQYPVTGLPTIGDYPKNEEMMLKLMRFVAAKTPGGGEVILQTRELINNHVPDWQVLGRIEWAMMEYNCSFFRDGKVSSFLDDLRTKLPESITRILTDLSQRLSQNDKPPSES